VRVDLSFPVGVVGAAIEGDVSDRQTMARASAAAAELGPLLGWVNCAGIQADEHAWELTEATVRRQLDVNIIGTMWGCAEAAHAVRAGGSIVSIGSIHGIRGFAGSFAYSATKGAVGAMSRQLAVDLAPRDIRVNSVLPGAILTAMCERDWQASPDPAAARAADEGLHLQNRMGDPREIATIVAFLLSGDSSLINGQEIVADGGASIRPPRVA
jgi:NAD(P)-dependent dehydrogenase (short-subunit alcohol dehydrogenase family)